MPSPVFSLVPPASTDLHDSESNACQQERQEGKLDAGYDPCHRLIRVLRGHTLDEPSRQEIVVLLAATLRLVLWIVDNAHDRVRVRFDDVINVVDYEGEGDDAADVPRRVPERRLIG